MGAQMYSHSTERQFVCMGAKWTMKTALDVVLKGKRFLRQMVVLAAFTTSKTFAET